MALKEAGGPNFLITPANAKNPFARSSTFTNHVWTEPYKMHEGAFDVPGTCCFHQHQHHQHHYY
jgi:hypothetical protein